MLPLYQKLAVLNPSQVQYITSIMICYKELGDYGMARQLAEELIKSNPELKAQVEQFLRSF
jgi:tetratricopeptide (TPR) repeat protein